MPFCVAFSGYLICVRNVVQATKDIFMAGFLSTSFSVQYWILQPCSEVVIGNSFKCNPNQISLIIVITRFNHLKSPKALFHQT